LFERKRYLLVLVYGSNSHVSFELSRGTYTMKNIMAPSRVLPESGFGDFGHAYLEVRVNFCNESKYRLK